MPKARSAQRGDPAIAIDGLAGCERIPQIKNDIGMKLLQLQERPTDHAHGRLKASTVYLDCRILRAERAQREGVVLRSAGRKSMHDTGNRRESRLGKDRYLRDAICL